MRFSSCLSRLGRMEGKSQEPVGARLPAQPTPSSARHTHRAADAGDIIIVKGRPAGVRIAIGGASHVGVSGQNTPVHEAEREEAGYDLRWITAPSGSTDRCLGSAQGCGWRNVETRAGSGVLQPSGRTLTCRTGRHLLLGLQHRPGTILPGTRRAGPHTPGVPQTTRRSAFTAGAQPAAANKTSPEHLYLDPSLINCLYLLFFHMPFS